MIKYQQCIDYFPYIKKIFLIYQLLCYEWERELVIMKNFAIVYQGNVYVTAYKCCQ